MGTTPTYALPYPEPTDRARNGSVAIKALAERLAVLLTPAYGIAPGASSSAQAGITSATPATFAGLFGSGEFTLESGSTIRYTGPTRWFLVDFEVEATLAGSATTNAAASVVVDGSATAGTSKTSLQIGGGGTGATQQMLRITTPVLLASGQALQLIVSGSSPGATFDKKQFRIASMGAPQ